MTGQLLVDWENGSGGEHLYYHILEHMKTKRDNLISIMNTHEWLVMQYS